MKGFRHSFATLYLLLLLMVPSLARLGHHHEYHAEKSRMGHVFASPVAACLICAFEFSSIDDSVANLQPDKPLFAVELIISFRQTLCHQTGQYSFQLRAPPLTA